MGDTTVQDGQQPNTAPQGDPAGTQQPIQPHAPGATPNAQQKDDSDEPLGPGGKKALKAERERADRFEAELKALEPLKKLAAALGNGDAGQGKSEIELLNEKFDQYEKKLVESEQGRLREKVARTFDLPDDLADLLRGDTEEELTAHAEVLKKYVPADAKKATNGSRPKPDRSQGGGGNNGHVSAKQQGLEQAAKRFGAKTKTT